MLAGLLAACGGGSPESNGSSQASQSGASQSGASQSDTAQSDAAQSEGGAAQGSAGQASPAESGGDQAGYPAYLNLDSAIPIVKDGESSPALKVVMVQNPGAAVWDELWVAEFFEKALNVKFDAEMVINTAREERLNLIFMANDLPDIMINMSVSPSDIYKYGAMEGMLLPMDGYISEALTPDIVNWFEKVPEARAYSTTPDGHIYFLPEIGTAEPGGLSPRTEYNMKWMEQLGIGMPATVDDLLAMLQAFKEADPGGTGNPVPLAAGYKNASTNPGTFLLASLGGYSVRGDAQAALGLLPSMQGGKVRLPVNDPEVYKEYLRVMNLMYAGGLIPENYFTIELNEVNALAAGGQAGMYMDVIHVSGVENWAEWTFAEPLTGGGNSQKVVPTPPAIVPGNYVVSSKTAHPELAMRIGNMFYTTWGALSWSGPGRDNEYAERYGYGYTLPYIDKATNNTWTLDPEDYPEGITGMYNYIIAVVGYQWRFGSINNTELGNENLRLLGGEPKPWPDAWNPAEPGGYTRIELYKKAFPHLAPVFPTIYYVDEDTQLAMTDLQVVLAAYVEEQYALFVTGQRPLDQFDAFMGELKGMGIDEYEQYFIDIYAGMGL
ncbi:MAG: extracellular solute-binding protein [Clostridiales bacterium]|nr:extracellular solute-binding protein [Clostridiales bacterium]